jgi:voltage-gated potassium channel
MKKKIKQIVEDTDTTAGRIFDLFIQFLIVLSLVSFSIETLPDLSASTKRILWIDEVIVVVIFTIEYLLRIFVADRKLKFIFSFYGLIDLFAILPFYVARGIDLRSIRVFRLFRLVRVFKIFRYSRAIQRFKTAFLIIKQELILFIISTTFLLYIGAVGIYYFERSAQPEHFKSVIHSLWWAVATLTTVGYGDVYPVTAGGKIFTFLMLMVGLGIIAVPAGLVASALTKTLEDEEESTTEQ